MRIKENQNLKYDKNARVLTNPIDYDKSDLHPRVCVLDSFEKSDHGLILYFKNKSQAAIKPLNLEGETEILLIQGKLPELIGRSYEEILETDI